MKYLPAFEPEHQKVVQFKPERIGRVEINGDSLEPDERYRIKNPGLFGKGGPQAEVGEMNRNDSIWYRQQLRTRVELCVNGLDK